MSAGSGLRTGRRPAAPFQGNNSRTCIEFRAPRRGIIVILGATVRFVRTGRLLDDQAMHSPGILPDLAFGVTLVLLLVGLSAYLVFA